MNAPSTAPDPGQSAPSRTRRLVAAAVLIVLVAAMGVHLARADGEWASIRRLSGGVVGFACLLQFAAQVLLNGSMLLPLRKCVAGLGFWELYLVRTGGSFVGSLVPVAGGLAVRLAYLKRRGLTYAEFTWATLLTNVLALVSAALLGMAATGVLWATVSRPPLAVIAVSAGLLAVSVAVMGAFECLPRASQHPRFARWRALSGMRGLGASRRLTFEVFALSLGRHLLNFLTFGVLYASLSQGPADLVAGGLVYALSSPVRMVNITPANLGVTEWFVALVGRLVAFDTATGLIVSLTFRGIGLVTQGAGAAFGSVWIAARGR